ncbi:regulator of G-protein signaling 17 [Myotis lucifugus]|uniref:regulator of G-protein signaling 17 n=1 Tax=Myotis lucifugus TaxID=59463 RepID=UPI0003C4D811|nr:regulator of G-protein signaling 17 [Myotis lucifugus]
MDSQSGTTVAEMRKRQQSQNEGTPAVSQAPGNQRPNNTCCFCWCCCCSCSCLTVRNEERAETAERPTLTTKMESIQVLEEGNKRPSFFITNLTFLSPLQQKVLKFESKSAFYKNSGAHSVSLDSRVREVINRNLLDPNPHMYEDAQLQIYTLMHRDSFPRFLNSQIYKSFVESTASSTSES